MPTHTITQMYQTPAGALTGVVPVTGDEETNADLTLAASSTNVELDVAFVRSKVLSMALFCTAACTVKTNSTGGADSVSLTANIPVICGTSAAVTALLPTADVTKLYLNCTAGGLFSFRAILDITP